MLKKKPKRHKRDRIHLSPAGRLSLEASNMFSFSHQEFNTTTKQQLIKISYWREITQMLAVVRVNNRYLAFNAFCYWLTTTSLLMCLLISLKVSLFSITYSNVCYLELLNAIALSGECYSNRVVSDILLCFYTDTTNNYNFVVHDVRSATIHRKTAKEETERNIKSNE